MKRIFSIVLLIMVLTFSLSINVFAGNLSNYDDLYSSDDIISNAPEIEDGVDCVVVWDSVNSRYVRFITNDTKVYIHVTDKYIDSATETGFTSVTYEEYVDGVWTNRRTDIAVYSPENFELVGVYGFSKLLVGGNTITSKDYKYYSLIKNLKLGVSNSDFTLLFSSLISIFPVVFTIMLLIFGIKKAIGFVKSILGV